VCHNSITGSTNHFMFQIIIPRVFNLKTLIKDANPSTLGPQMKLIWVLLKNKCQNNIFRPNRVKPHVHRSTGDREVHHHRLAGGVHPVNRTGRPLAIVRSGRPMRLTGGELQFVKTRRNQFKNLQIQSQFTKSQGTTTKSGF